MKSFATVAVLLLGLTSSASALFFKNESMINQNGADLGCFNTFETTNSNAFDVCTWGLLGGAFFIFFFASYAGMSPDISARHGYDNAYNYEQQRGDLGKHPFANSGNIVSKAVSKIGNFWKKRLLGNGGIAEREYPYGQTYHPEQQQQAQAVQA